MMKKRLPLISLISLIMLSLGCTSQNPNERTISVSILPIKFFVDKISGNEYNTVVIVPPGASPETYEPLPSQIKQMANSMAYFQIGLIDFEKTTQTSIIENNASLKIINLSNGLDLIEGKCHHQHENSHAHNIDPHIWLSPDRVAKMIQKITHELSEINHENKLKYEHNSQALIETIDSINNCISLSFKELSAKTFVTYHPFLGYFAEDYSLVQIPIEVDGKEPSALQYKSTIDTITSLKINTLFYQSQSAYESIKSIIEVTDVTPVKIDPLAYDWVENIKYIASQLLESLKNE